jgi:tungstate transport system permease protein
MHDIGRAFLAALNLIGSLDTELIGIVGLSLQVSLTATLIAMAIGAPMAGLLAVSRFRGQQAVIVAANAMLGLPPVAVGLFVYLLLSRSGPWASRDCCFRPWP